MKVTILKQKRILDNFCKVDEITLQHEKFDGTMTLPMTRLNFDRGDSVAAVVYNYETDSVILTRQFRLPVYLRLNNADKAVLTEVAAGMIDKGEMPKDAIIREVREELGYEIVDIRLLFKFFLSPGGCSELIHLFFVEVFSNDKVASGGGRIEENEDIKICEITEIRRRYVFDVVEQGEIMDAKTIIGLQWLKENGK
jgi:nudix-type nucleoside diphosphatase (YffH/AdpP family)